MAYRPEIDDSGWDEVEFINSYALFMGYISMAIKGLAFLILTWTTVVLLGGFVSMLQKKDLWCLTFITLVQTAGIFDVYQNEKLSYIANSAWGLMAGAVSAVMGKGTYTISPYQKWQTLFLLARVLLASVFLVVQMLVLAILVCPLAAIYVCGLLISTGISIWRLVLVQNDYGSNTDGEANLKPAMDTLYSLALLQGVLFCYRFLFSLTSKRLASRVIPEYEDIEDRQIVLTYLRQTRIGCEKDPSFAKGRNLITHAVDLIGSKSRDECTSGVEMLYTAIQMGEKRLDSRVKGYREDCLDEIIGQHMMMKILITSVSSSPVLQKLLQAMDPWGAFDRDTRNQCATIVAHLALDIHLEQFPGAIQYICTLIGSFEEYRLNEPYHRDWLPHKYGQYRNRQHRRLPSPGNDARSLQDAYREMVLTGLCILRMLATHQNNCRIMSRTKGLIPRIMAPITSDIIHRFRSCAWSTRAVEESLQVMLLLVTAPGKTGANLRREISRNKEAMSTMERILSCDSCCARLQRRAMGILIQVYMDSEKNRAAFIKLLLDIFLAGDSKRMPIRKLAGEALAKLCIQDGSNTSIILQVNGNVLGRLTKILLLEDAENKSCRIRVAEIIEHTCIHQNQTRDDECLGKLKKHMTNAMPKVFAQILSCGLKKDDTHARTEEDQAEVTEIEVDIENQIDHPQENGREKTSSVTHHQNNEDNEDDMQVEEDETEHDKDFHTAFLSLCVTISETFMSADQDLACQFDAISLPVKLKDMVAKNRIPTMPCLRLMKLTCKMVISMLKHRGSYLKEDLESLTGELSIASEDMSLLDISMVFASKDDGAATTMKPVRSLDSLVKEVKESVDAYFKAQKPENIEPFTSTDG